MDNEDNKTYLNAKTKSTAIFKPKSLTRKQAAFVKQLVDNPKVSPTKAALAVYGKPDKPLTYDTAGTIASENMQKPAVIMALSKHSDLFESAIVGTVRDWQQSETPRKREIALDAAKYGHDKIFGKSTVKIEQQTSIVQISINLTGDGEQPPDDVL